MWKKAIIVAVHKKGDKQLKKSYRPVSLLSISGRIFEKIIFNSLFKHLDDHNLLNNKRYIYTAFDTNLSLEVRGVFLNLFKAFDGVWLEVLMYILKRLLICGKFYGLIHSFLSNRYQRVVLNGKS